MISDRQLEEISNLAAESELDHETALARAYELLLLRELHRACRARHPYSVLDRIPAPADIAATCRQRIREALEQSPAAAGDLVPDLVTTMKRGT
jgi:hypothetical protein